MSNSHTKEQLRFLFAYLCGLAGNRFTGTVVIHFNQGGVTKATKEAPPEVIHLDA